MHETHVCVQVHGSNVAWLLDMAAYLEVQALQDACCEVCVCVCACGTAAKLSLRRLFCCVRRSCSAARSCHKHTHRCRHHACACARAAQFLSSALSPETVVDVLLMAHHYHCSRLAEEGVRGASCLSAGSRCMQPLITSTVHGCVATRHACHTPPIAAHVCTTHAHHPTTGAVPGSAPGLAAAAARGAWRAAAAAAAPAAPADGL
jgi:hypothetical protein